MMEAIQHTLYLVSNALLLPTLVAILIIGAWTAIMAGGLLREWLSRREVRRTFREVLELVTHGRREAALGRLRSCSTGVPGCLSQMLAGWPADELERDKCLSDLESEMTSSLSKLSWVTRIGPMLGLMGTLIPLGPALTGLASGNVATLSSNLVVAFTATVMGVLIGCVAFTMSLVRRDWYDRDLSDLEYVFAKSFLQPHAQEKEEVG
ncbi:MotA/TolQ/ExbB proton channel [Chthoniobacter flavus Ellin428]|uniref:MotA/TolQ/ExbB proton channel n=1 Tax=Chthoniobacter flavus Ellin428 TaxID=497964 RepID=B4D1P4_9BACT|nr:MotA/TolQ/ExbB proton channel family protein [Chthoniobacter flavus]EDY19656.1 MotA/TolQ/ExbB proton channel [Chthoniobacter flavus Ellin428]TCO92893.1 outer membrane transport energization protein ExbB [Chthoniobacter flavus]